MSQEKEIVVKKRKGLKSKPIAMPSEPKSVTSKDEMDTEDSIGKPYVNGKKEKTEDFPKYIGPEEYAMKIFPDGKSVVYQKERNEEYNVSVDGKHLETKKIVKTPDTLMKDFISTQKPSKNYYYCTDHVTALNFIKPVTLIVAANDKDAGVMLEKALKDMQLYTPIDSPFHLEPVRTDGPFCSIISPRGKKNETMDPPSASLDDYYAFKKGKTYDKGLKSGERSLYICENFDSISTFPAIAIAFARDQVEAEFLLDKELWKQGLKSTSQKPPSMTRIVMEKGVKILYNGV